MQGSERESLFADLRHSDEEIRRLAVERASQLPALEAVTVLVESLGDASWRVRKAAVERLTALDDATDPVHALVQALADGENPGRRNAALEALTSIGAVAVPVLIETSRDLDSDVRKQAVDALAAIGAPAAAERLLVLLVDPDANVRASAAEALGTLGSQPAASALIARVVADPEPIVRLAALRSLARLEASLSLEELAPALADPLLRPAAYLLLAWSDDCGAEDTLTKALSSRARSAREAAMEALVKRASQAPPGEELAIVERLRAACGDAPFLPDALKRLGDAPLTTRLVLVQFLGWLGRPDCVGPLLDAARDEALSEVVLGVLAGAGAEVEAQVARIWPTLSDANGLRAAALLGRTRGEAGEALLQAALGAPDAALRSLAAHSLAERGTRAALPALVMALRVAATAERDGDGDASERDACNEIEAAIHSLLDGADTALGDRVAALLEADIDGAPEGFRLATARLLGRSGCAGHRPRIELLLSDPSAAVRRAAVEALAQVAPQQLEPLRCALADEAPLVRIGAAKALAASGDRAAVADLAGLMDDPEPRVVAAALRALARWVAAAADEEARGRALLLLSVGLAHGGASGLAALDALSTIGGEDAVSLARSALNSPDAVLAEAAVACVGAHAQREQLSELLPCLAHSDWNVRARVAQVLQERRHIHGIPALMRRLDVELDEFARGAILAALESLESH